MINKKTVRDINVEGRRVLVRVDFNVPLADGKVTDDTRIRAALPTISYLIHHDAKVVICSHLGRPKGKQDTQFSLGPVALALADLLGQEVKFVGGDIDDNALAAAKDLRNGDVMIIENLRFNPGEQENDPEFSKLLASLADIYVNDAFGTAHRSHASTAGVPEHLPAVSGLLLAHEVEMLTSVFEKPEKPFVGILGGAKVSDKIGVIERLIETCETLLIGGGMAFTFLAAKGVSIGQSLVEREWIDRARYMLEKATSADCRILLPVDLIVAAEISDDAETFVVRREEIPGDMKALDIGPTTCEIFSREIGHAKTIYWNGPMGVFEVTPFEEGTRIVAEAVARNSRATSIIGGGDSVAALKKFECEDRVTFVSTGGGASMKLLEGAQLPGLEALDTK